MAQQVFPGHILLRDKLIARTSKHLCLGKPLSTALLTISLCVNQLLLAGSHQVNACQLKGAKPKPPLQGMFWNLKISKTFSEGELFYRNFDISTSQVAFLSLLKGLILRQTSYLTYTHRCHKINEVRHGGRLELTRHI